MPLQDRILVVVSFMPKDATIPPPDQARITAMEHPTDVPAAALPTTTTVPATTVPGATTTTVPGVTTSTAPATTTTAVAATTTTSHP